jgi:integrase
MAKLTAASVKKWKVADKRQEVPDDRTPGLYLIVQPTGRKAWAVRYRSGTKHRRMRLGAYPALGLADARDKARKVQAEAEAGGDPAGDREREKAEEAERQASERDKIKTLVEGYHKRRLSKLKSGDDVLAQFRRHVLPAWGERDVHEITRRDVHDLLDGIADSGRVVTANRVRAYLSTFFNWCVDRDVIAASPLAGVKPLAKETARDRVLSDDQIRWLWQACDDLGQPWGPFGKALLLTGQRRAEVAGMTEAEIDGDLWHMSAARTKNGRPHDVPLSEAARGALAGVERIKGDAGLIFTTTGKTPLSGFTRGLERLHKRMTEIAAQERGEPVEIPHWTFHDLRRTAETTMARLGISQQVIDRVTNHATGQHRMARIYNRYDYLEEKRHAVEALARFVIDLTEGTAENVVPIAEGRA